MPNYRQVARQKARKYGLDPNLFVRQIQAESGFNPRAGSPAGAQGIAQIMPGTASAWGVNPNDPVAALDASAKNMARYVKKYGIEGALRAYNAGEGAIEKSKGYGETNAYVKKILGGMKFDSSPARARPSTAAGAPRTTIQRTPDTTVVDKEGAIVGALLGRKFGDKGSLLADYQGRIASGAYTSTVPGTPVTSPVAPVRPAPARQDSSRLAPGGNYKGTEGPIIQLAQLAHAEGLKTTSAKRNNQNPASGSRSDHDFGNKDATARDLSNGSSPTPQMDAAAVKIARALGNKTYKKGQKLELVTTINGVRYQVLYRTNLGGNHFNHLHVGAKRVG